jgi:cobaltochelatase CobN
MMKNKSMRSSVLLVLVLFVVQIFAPLAVAQAQSEDNEAGMAGNFALPEYVSKNIAVNATDRVVKRNSISFVLGTDENLLSLENASMNAAVNATVAVKIYNATEAKSANFSNGSVVFLASLDNETVASINSTINSSADVFAYNLATNVSIGNVDDVNITKYWVYGGDENINNLILYMNNTFYGGTTLVNSPEPPGGRAKVAFIVHEKVSYGVWLKKASEDVYVSRCLNVSLCTYTVDNPESYENLNLSDQDVILFWMIGYPVEDAIKDTVLEARSNNNADVIAIDSADVHGLSNVNLSIAPYDNISIYWANGGTENMRRLLVFSGVKLCDIPVEDFGLGEIPPPLEVPQYGIYHPDAVGKGIQELGIFPSIDDYLAWYKGTGKFNESAPTVGIHYYYASGKGGSYPVINSLIWSLESKGANVIFATYTYEDQNRSKYFIQDNKSIVDAALVLSSFRLDYFNPERGVNYLKNLNVTPLKGITTYYASAEEWENSTGLSLGESWAYIALPELDGLTDFILVGANLKDPVSGLNYHMPVDYQINWITDRAIAWATLHRMNNSEKKIAIIYYNHGGGKDNLGATYLDITPSLNTLLAEMKEEGYKVEGEASGDKELLDLMLHQGRNIGTWAPGELDNMVNNYSVVLIPENEYKGWFDELPANKRQEVIEKWGEPPGEIMVYENATGKYIVIPKLSFGNVLLAPQPTRGWLQDQAILYHDKELAPHHQNIAFYLWLKKEYGADAIVHFGTHGTQEWLPGKERALSARECWPAILIQDLPVEPLEPPTKSF